MSDDDGRKEGFAAAVEEAVDRDDRGGPGDPEPEQLGLLPLGRTVAEEAAAQAGGRDRRGPGRPKGSKNKRTEEWQAYLLNRYTSPLEVLAQTYSRPVGELAAELGCKREDAFKLQILAAKELAPYVHQKLPVAVDLGGATIAPVQILVDPELARQMGVGQVLDHDDGADIKFVENQSLSEASAEKSDGGKSDDGE